MKKKLYSILGILLIISACENKPEKYEVYESLLYTSVKAQVLFVGKNWEIKDAVNEGKINDSPFFHNKSFWSHSNDETLIAVRFGATNNSVAAFPLEEFKKEFKLLSKN